MSILNTIKGCPLFYELYDSEIIKIVEKCQVLHLQPNDYIFRNNEMGDDLFLILSGSAVVEKNGLKLASLRKGDLFGEMVLLKDNKRNADIYSDNFSSVLRINYDDIFSFYQNDKKIFSLLTLNLARLMATRLKKAGSHIADLKEKIHDLEQNSKNHSSKRILKIVE